MKISLTDLYPMWFKHPEICCINNNYAKCQKFLKIWFQCRWVEKIK